MQENRNFTSDAFTYNNLGDGDYQQEEGRNGMSTTKNDSRLIAFFGRVNYSYNDKYLATASLRYEGSSRVRLSITNGDIFPLSPWAGVSAVKNS